MRTIVLSIVFVVCQQSIMAQSEKAPGFLWQVNMNGSEFYLAGSIHAGKKEFYPLPQAYLDAFNKSDHVIFELRDDFKTIREKIFSYAAKDSLEEGQSLDQYLGGESKKILDTLFKGEEETLLQYYRYKGWLLNMAVQGMAPKMIGYDPGQAVDKYFHDLATEAHKKILGLDKVETQLQLFEFDVPLETQVHIIETGLKSVEQRALAEKPIFESYYNQDTEAFREAFFSTMNLENPQIRAMYEKVFVNRNRAWVDKLIELSNTQQGHYFMLVGSGHYFGPDNVLELLRQKGYTVKQYSE